MSIAAAAALSSAVEHARASSMCVSASHTVSTTRAPATPLDMGEITLHLPSAATPATPAAADPPPPPPHTPSISPFVEEKRPSGLRIVRPVSAVAQQAVSAALHRHLSSSDMTSPVASPQKGPQHRRDVVEQMPPTPSNVELSNDPLPLVSWRTMPVAGAALRQTESQSVAANLLTGETSSATAMGAATAPLGSRKGLFTQDDDATPHESTSSDSDFELPMPPPTSSTQGIQKEMAPAHAGEEEKASDSPLGSTGKVYDNVIYSPTRSRRADRSRARTSLDGGSGDDEGSEEKEELLAPVTRARDSPQPSQKPSSSAQLKRSKIAFTPVSATHADQQAAADEPLTPRSTTHRPSSTGDSGESPSTSALAQVAGARHRHQTGHLSADDPHCNPIGLMSHTDTRHTCGRVHSRQDTGDGGDHAPSQQSAAQCLLAHHSRRSAVVCSVPHGRRTRGASVAIALAGWEAPLLHIAAEGDVDATTGRVGQPQQGDGGVHLCARQAGAQRNERERGEQWGRRRAAPGVYGGHGVGQATTRRRVPRPCAQAP